MQEEFASVRATPEQVRDVVHRSAGLRPGFSRLVGWAADGGHRLIIFSSGFRSVIRDVLAGMGHDEIEVVSHDAVFRRGGRRDPVVRPRRDVRRLRAPLQAPRPAPAPPGRDRRPHRRRDLRRVRREDGRRGLRPRAPGPRPRGRRRALHPVRGLRRGPREAPRGTDPGGMSDGGWRPVPPAAAWGEMEERVLAFWRERDVFHRSLAQRAGEPPWVFYEGPPTANGRPGSHHVLSRVFKDIFPRFQTMRGRFVDRRGGWDCHGLPVELEVEKRLGISGKPEIEAYGIAEFNALCRESVLTYLDEWERLTERIGFWIDTDRAYRTMDASYVESVWWSLAELHRRGQLYQSDKVVPYCPRCGTALSSHEVALGYEDVDDPSVYVRFRAARRGRVAAGVDHHPVDAAVQPGGGRRAGRDVRRGRGGRRDAHHGRAARGEGAGRGGPARPHVPGLRAGGPGVRAPVPVHRGRPPGGRRPVRHDRGRHRDRPHRAGIRRGRHGHRPSPRAGRPQPGRARRPLHRRRRGRSPTAW